MRVGELQLHLIPYKRYLEGYTHSMETIYLSLRALVAVGTFFMVSPVSVSVRPCNISFCHPHNVPDTLMIIAISLLIQPGKIDLVICGFNPTFSCR